jgi:uncharacterized protein (DUF1810 family)
MPDPYKLQRFVEAQDGVIDRVRAELGAGRKQGHWMWFVFPQLFGLGKSAMAVRYSIGSREEAAAYLAHPVLGPRLRECTELVLAVEGRDAHAIFGSPDDMKFHSSMTLFAAAAPMAAVFRAALDKYFGGKMDSMSMTILERL